MSIITAKQIALVEDFNDKNREEGVEPIGRCNSEQPLEEKFEGLALLVHHAFTHDKSAQDKKQINPKHAMGGKKISHEALALETMEDLHIMIINHHPCSKSPKDLQQFQFLLQRILRLGKKISANNLFPSFFCTGDISLVCENFLS